MNLSDLYNEFNEKNEKRMALAEIGNKLTESQVEQLDVLNDQCSELNHRIQTLENAANGISTASQSRGRQTEPNPTQGGYASTGRPYNSAARVNDSRSKTADYLAAVRAQAQAQRAGGLLDRRHEEVIKFFNAPTTYGTEAVPPDGGFAVPPDIRADIIDKLNGEFSILGLVNQINTASNSITLTKNEVPSFDNSTGPRVYWTGEASQLTESKPLLENVTVPLNKLTCLVPVSEELTEDAPSLDNYLRRTVADKFVAELNSCFISGSGVGRPLGLLNAGATVSVAKASAQAADTILFANIVDMWSRMYAPCTNRAVWMINQDILPQLFQMVLAGTSNDVPVFLPASGAAGSPYATLMGRPIIPVQACSTLGDKGDIILADWSQYICGVKGGGLRTDISMHLYFDYDVLAYRFILRLGGQPLWRSAISPASGSGNTLSCFCVLDERSGE